MKTLKILAVLAFLIIISAFAAINFHLFQDEYQVGDVAADFSLKNIDGEMVSLADRTDAKGFIVVFTCNTCPFAQANEKRIIALDAKFDTQGYPVIAINPNDPEVKAGESLAAMQTIAKEHGYTFPYLADDHQEVFPEFGAKKTPTVFVLQKQNDELIVKYKGAIDDSARDEAAVNKRFVEDAVEALLAGKTIKTNNTKAIGCAIKA